MRYRFEPVMFASAPLDKRDWRWHLTSAFSQHLRKYTFTAVHTKTHRRRFQIYPVWRAFSNLCVYGERFHRLRVDARPKRIKNFAFTSVCVYNRLLVDGALVCSSVNRSFSDGSLPWCVSSILSQKEAVSEFLKKLWCCVGGRVKHGNLASSNKLIKDEFPQWKVRKVDVSSVTSSSEWTEELWVAVGFYEVVVELCYWSKYGDTNFWIN